MPLSLLSALLIGVTALGPYPPQPQPLSFSVDLQWTAPGDDDKVGRAYAYDLRYSTEPITPANFAAATHVAGVPPPNAAGSRERFTVTDLPGPGVYYFALKVRDEAGNWSSLSNVAAFPEIALGVGDLPADLRFSAPMPNPARSKTRCTFAMTQGGEVRVDVFSESGRHVRQLANGWRPAGRGEVVWDLRDASGRSVAAGIYLVRAEIAGQRSTRSLAVVR